MKLLIFSGTSEGHALCRFLSAHGGTATAFVATAYGEQVQESLAGITVHTGRLTAAQMAERMDAGTLVVDATHPYAREVSENLRAACRASGAEYARLVRPALPHEGVVTVRDTAEAVRWLNAHPGRVLLTTGSKELEAYTAVTDYRTRLFPRVLPTASVLQKCEALGFAGAQIIAMQGPFSHEMNVALIERTGAEILVTKDTGGAGGFAEKLSAACETGAQVLVIARPDETGGRTLDEMQRYLAGRLGLLAPAPRFPLFIDLRGKRCVVFGAGKIAARRIEVLGRFGAEVVVVAPEARAAVPLTHARGYDRRDLAGAALAVAATDDRAVNQRIGADCRAAGVPVSVADCAAESTFYFPAVCLGGGLSAGVVSDGTAHHAVAAAARRIRAVLEGPDGTDQDRKP